MNIPESCKGCGKCCIWKEFEAIPLYRFCDDCSSPSLIYGRCEHLNENNECIIYNEKRPTSCILTKRGSEDCMKFLAII